MPRVKSTGEKPDRSSLYQLAAVQAGYFTLQEAIQTGYSAPLLQYYCGTGEIERAGRGIFRLSHFPSADHEDLIVSWLWSGKVGIFSHDTALELLDLSDIMPAQKHLTVPTSWRARRIRVPAGVVLHYGDIAPQDTTWVGPIPVTTPMRTISDSIADGVQPELVQQAIRQALRRGLIRKSELVSANVSLEVELDHSP